jgi:hypothetical protein
MAKLKDENLIHIKLSHSEAVNSKVDILSTQMHLIKMLKTMKTYHKLRSEDLKVKAKIHRKLKELENSIHKLELLLPKIKIPRILQHGQEAIVEEVDNKIRKENKHRSEEKNKDYYDKDLEVQLKDIQEKLMKLT